MSYSQFEFQSCAPFSSHGKNRCTRRVHRHGCAGRSGANFRRMVRYRHLLDVALNRVGVECLTCYTLQGSPLGLEIYASTSRWHLGVYGAFLDALGIVCAVDVLAHFSRDVYFPDLLQPRRRLAFDIAFGSGSRSSGRSSVRRVLSARFNAGDAAAGFASHCRRTAGVRQRRVCGRVFRFETQLWLSNFGCQSSLYQ